MKARRRRDLAPVGWQRVRALGFARLTGFLQRHYSQKSSATTLLLAPHPLTKTSHFLRAANSTEARQRRFVPPLERGCVEDQPQHVQIASRLHPSNAPDKAKLLRLVGTTQPRSFTGIEPPIKLLPLLSPQQMLTQKLDRAEKLEVGILLFGETVTFVLCHQIPTGATLSANGFDHLLRFRYWHARVIRAIRSRVAASGVGPPSRLTRTTPGSIRPAIPHMSVWLFSSKK
jgi:hypothetical protein